QIDKEFSVSHGANTIFKYAKLYLDLNLAVQEGILEGTIQTINDVKRIAELASKTVYGLATDPEKTIEKIGTKLQEVKKSCIETVLAISQIATDPEIRSKVLTEIYDTPTRDKVKTFYKIATETYLQTNILKAAIIGGNKTIDLAKSAQRRSKDILVAAQGFVECPHSVIIEEVSALLSETATTEPKVLKAVLSNACKDAALISEISNAEVSIGEGISALANDTELAANISIKHNCKAQGWNLSENGSFINGRYYSKHALERMAPINAEVRAVLEKRALKKYPLRYPLEAHEEYNKYAYGEYAKYINSRNISPSAVENAISTGVKKTKPNNTIEYLTSDV
ncbi:hypothetical protein EB001_28040, partial [bacterium]|nr:hypothetical protein [bacterium]